MQYSYEVARAAAVHCNLGVSDRPVAPFSGHVLLNAPGGLPVVKDQCALPDPFA
jgi:hypothetical protein